MDLTIGEAGVPGDIELSARDSVDRLGEIKAVVAKAAAEREARTPSGECKQCTLRAELTRGDAVADAAGGQRFGDRGRCDPRRHLRAVAGVDAVHTGMPA